MKAKISRENVITPNQADTIVDPLCTIDAVAIERGRNFLDEEGPDKTIFDISLPYRNLPLPGKIIEINDGSLGRVFKSKLLSVNISIGALTESNPVVVNMDISVEKSEE